LFGGVRRRFGGFGVFIMSFGGFGSFVWVEVFVGGRVFGFMWEGRGFLGVSGGGVMLVMVCSVWVVFVLLRGWNGF